MMLELPVEPYASHPDTDTGTIAAFDIGADGHPYILTASRPIGYVNEVPGGAIVPQIRPKVPQRYHIYRLASAQPRLLMIVEDEAFNIHTIQPLGGQITSSSFAPAASIAMREPTRTAAFTTPAVGSRKESSWAMASGIWP